MTIPAVIDPLFVLSNRLEAGLWSLIGAAFLISSIRTAGVARRDSILAGITFIIFGASDLVEATTGAWWRPIWLLLWKAACLLIFAILLIRYLRRRTSRG